MKLMAPGGLILNPPPNFYFVLLWILVACDCCPADRPTNKDTVSDNKSCLYHFTR